MRRSYHAAVCLGYGGDHPKLLVIGGRGPGKTLNDVWMLDLQSRRWKEVSDYVLYTKVLISLAILQHTSPNTSPTWGLFSMDSFCLISLKLHLLC